MDWNIKTLAYSDALGKGHKYINRVSLSLHSFLASVIRQKAIFLSDHSGLSPVEPRGKMEDMDL